MSEIELVKIVLKLIEDYGPTVYYRIEAICKGLAKVEGRSHCEKIVDGKRCGLEGSLHTLVIDGKSVFKCKCPVHGFTL